ncbi:MAG: hypothetical protein GY884_21450 [Proteobacteria bacterium]|nr:hypothetical protein [Pseudomonadota bacterium]
MRHLVPLVLLGLTGCKLADELLDAGVTVSKHSDDLASAAVRQADELGAVSKVQPSAWKALGDEAGDQVRDALFQAMVVHLVQEIHAPDMGGHWVSETDIDDGSSKGAFERRWLGGGLYAFEGTWTLHMELDNAEIDVAMQMSGVEAFGADKMCSVATSFSASVLSVELAAEAAALRPELQAQLHKGMDAAYAEMGLDELNQDPCDTVVARSASTLTYRTLDGDLVSERRL